MARAGRALEGRAHRCRESLALLASRPAFADPRSWISTRRATLLLTRGSLDRWPVQRLERERTRLTHAHDRLRLLGPAATLERGYAIVQDADGARGDATARVVTAGDRRRHPAVPGSAGGPGGGGVASERAELTFEQARAELEQIVRRLEDGQTSLDESLRCGSAASSCTRSAWRG